MVQAAIPVALAVGSSVMKGVAGYEAGRKNRNNAYAQAREQENLGVATEARIRDGARMQMGDQIAAQFSNGFMGGSGSALDALTQSQINAAMDALNVRREAASKAASLRASGDMAMSEGRMALVGSLFDAGSSIVGMKSDWAAAKSGMTPAPKGGG